MPQGMQIFDANGTLKVDVTDRLTRYLGSFNIPSTNGTQGTVAVPALGTPWFMFEAYDNSGQAQYPLIRLNGQNIEWSLSVLGGANANAIGGVVRYGVY